MNKDTELAGDRGVGSALFARQRWDGSKSSFSFVFIVIFLPERWSGRWVGDKEKDKDERIKIRNSGVDRVIWGGLYAESD
ncbi:MAG: hypothetical protein SynsKO_27150 [Synoicihabitans sp.]